MRSEMRLERYDVRGKSRRSHTLGHGDLEHAQHGINDVLCAQAQSNAGLLGLRLSVLNAAAVVELVERTGQIGDVVVDAGGVIPLGGWVLRLSFL